MMSRKACGCIHFRSTRPRHDAFTGLANRALFRKRMTKAIQTSRDDNTSMAVLFLDLDRFKRMNDRFGHNVGDELLVLVAQRLCQCVRENEFHTAVHQQVTPPENTL
jgi:diguanylate cyclase (GGDEF)-like protein